MKRLSYQQMIIGLDKLMFGSDALPYEVVQDQADAIEAYLSATGWSWDLIIGELSREEVSPVSTSPNN